jgi:hypothetical protein
MEDNYYSIHKIVNGRWVLDDCYILSYRFEEGAFSEKNLKINIYIDIYYDCNIWLSYNDKKRERKYINKEMQLSFELKELLKCLLKQDKIDLKYNYSDFFLEDSGDEFIIINHKETSHNINLGIILKEIKPNNISEEIFFRLFNEFTKIKEELYFTK